MRQLEGLGSPIRRRTALAANPVSPSVKEHFKETKRRNPAAKVAVQASLEYDEMMDITPSKISAHDPIESITPERYLTKEKFEKNQVGILCFYWAIAPLLG